jgi:hypothetical protein
LLFKSFFAGVEHRPSSRAVLTRACLNQIIEHLLQIIYIHRYAVAATTVMIRPRIHSIGMRLEIKRMALSGELSVGFSVPSSDIH